jgi:hypothetical protein
MQPMMTDDELAFLARGLRATDVAWEWGAGASSPWLARKVKRLTSVEHDRMYAQTILPVLPSNASLVWCPPDRLPAAGDDGDDNDFWHYARTYSGEGVTAVIIDGRARVACARRVAETAPFGPHQDMRIWLHDCDRREYEPIWILHLRPVDRVGNLMLLEARL